MGALLARRVYWDSCTFLGLINKELEKHSDCLAVWNEANEGKTIIYTSFFTYAEVFKAKCEDAAKPLNVEGDKAIEAILQQEFIQGVLVDEGIGIAARRLMRAHAVCKKPADAVHLATALRLNVDEMHTYDGSDLLLLNEKIMGAHGRFLKICRPAKIPSPQAPILEFIDKDKTTDAGKKTAAQEGG